MISHQTVQSALSFKPQCPDSFHRYLKLCLSYVEFVSPLEIQWETGRLVKLLSQYPAGLDRESLLALFYPDYPQASSNRQQSLKLCLEKLIQRARQHFQRFDLYIAYSRESRKYRLDVL